jgi:hypothetical protein
MARHHSRAPKRVVSLGKVCEDRLHIQKEKKKVSGSGKVVERCLAWSWPYEELKLPQWRHMNHGVGLVILNFGKQIIVSLSWFTFRFTF